MIYGCDPFRLTVARKQISYTIRSFVIRSPTCRSIGLSHPSPTRWSASRTQDGARTINVDFFGGRVKFEHVSHLLNLAPGPYRFQGRERSQDLQNERGLRWRIACVGDDAETLGTTDLVSGDTPWRTFTVDFTVPTGKCPYQMLVLELPARAALETEVVGRVSYTDLDLRPK